MKRPPHSVQARRRRIEESWLATPAAWSPFTGMEVVGWPSAVFVRGKLVMQEDETVGEPAGRLVGFK